MGDNLYSITDGFWTTTSSINSWCDATYQVKCADSETVKELEQEVKELRKRLSNLATLVCTHIGKEQMEKFYKENE